MASHDLQEPLRKVHTFAEGLKTKAVALGKRERDYRERKDGATKRVQNLIDGLLVLSKTSAQAQLRACRPKRSGR